MKINLKRLISQFYLRLSLYNNLFFNSVNVRTMWQQLKYFMFDLTHYLTNCFYLNHISQLFDISQCENLNMKAKVEIVMFSYETVLSLISVVECA